MSPREGSSVTRPSVRSKRWARGEEVGSGLKNVRKGDRVLVSCITVCGGCRFCRESRYGLCTGGGRLDPGSSHRRDPGGVRPGAVRRHVHLSEAGRGSRRGRVDALRHRSRGLRGGVPNGGVFPAPPLRGGRRSDRIVLDAHRSALLAQPDDRDRHLRRAPRSGRRPSVPPHRSTTRTKMRERLSCA
jgi:Alcohol dehydrogenase GroES-like domain